MAFFILLLFCVHVLAFGMCCSWSGLAWSPCYMTYFSLVKSTGKTPGHFTTPTSGSCVTMSSLGLFVCDSCELDVPWTSSRGLHLCNFGRGEGSPLHYTLLLSRKCNFLGKPLQPPCTSALQLVPHSTRTALAYLGAQEQGSVWKLLQDKTPEPMLVTAGRKQLQRAALYSGEL